jgi:polyphosphate kinase
MPINQKIINRELSWLSFNERVLQEAADPNVPLIERFRFLGIYSNNQDEFFKVRVATIKRMIDVENSMGVKNKINPKKILNEIQDNVIKLKDKFEENYSTLIHELAKHNIYIINEKQLNSEQALYVRDYFREHVHSVITPIMVHNVTSFPHLKDKSIYLAVKLYVKDDESACEYAVIEVPTDDINRFIVLPPVNRKKFIIILDDVIRFCLDNIFATFNYTHFEAYTIKLTRDAELDIDNDLSKSFLDLLSESVSSRKKGQPVRFVYDSLMPDDLLHYITNQLELDDEDNLIPAGRYHNFKDYMKFPNLGGKNLVYKPTPSISHPLIKHHQSLFEVISKQDILLHVPYQKFDHYINFLREASIDPKVTSIKITLYRVAWSSRVINALINAALNGKKVTVVIELQARFDEKSNIYFSKKLQEAGVHVIFGMRGLKVHSKMTLITRKEKKLKVKYATVGTGNFHEGTANVYADLHLLTKDIRITNEVSKVFKFFETTYKTYNYKHLMVSPLYMRKRIYSMIDNEIKNAQQGKDAYIILKINSLVDPDMVRKLYQANMAGVKIKGIIRGMCSLLPGVKGLSENIEIVSIVDKFLEHARVFVFCNNNKELYFLSSADLMTRNLDTRIEVACPVYDPEIQKELRTMLNIQLKDNVKARIIDAEQNNQYKQSTNNKKIRSQIELWNYYRKKSSGEEN